MKAAKQLKSKLCCGTDGIPLNVIKDLGIHFPDIFLELFNLILKTSIPTSWKTALVSPIHKKGDKTLVTQYRPISNFNSSSKLFEKVILGKLDAWRA